jgi:hypothetical protein
LLLSGRRDPVVRAVKPFGHLSELRRELTLQAIDPAGKFGDSGAGFGLHGVEPRPDAFEGSRLLGIQALGAVHSLDPCFKGADFVGHLVHRAEAFLTSFLLLPRPQLR